MHVAIKFYNCKTAIVLLVLCFYIYEVFARNGVFECRGQFETVLIDNNAFCAKKHANKFKMTYVKVKDVFKDMVIPNTLYEIGESYNLGGKVLYIPENSILYIRNGVFTNGRIEGNNTLVISTNRVIFESGHTTYIAYINDNGKYDYVTCGNGAITLSGTWSNEVCGDKWTGLKERSPYCSSIAINNYITLHKINSHIVIPQGKYIIYQTIYNRSHTIDFSGSLLELARFEVVQETDARTYPYLRKTAIKHPGDLLRVVGDSVIISNLTIDGESLRNNNVASGLGVEHSIRIQRSRGALLKNIIIRNTIGCGVAMSNLSSDITFQNVVWDNIGEHGVYSHAREGIIRFNDCTFRNCGQSKTIYRIRNGFSACVRPSTVKDEDLMKRSVRYFYNNCKFINDGEIPVLTNFSGSTYTEFNRCSWIGNILGYSENSSLPEALGHNIEYVFRNCDNPVSRYSGLNTIRKLYNCFNVRNLFEDLGEAHNCKCIWSYSDVYNRYSNQLIPGIVRIDSCIFKAGRDERPRVVIHNARSMEFTNCEFDFDINDFRTNFRGLLFVLKKELKPVSISFQKCRFKHSLSNLLDISNIRLLMSDCTNNKGKLLRFVDSEKQKDSSEQWRFIISGK